MSKIPTLMNHESILRMSDFPPSWYDTDKTKELLSMPEKIKEDYL